MWNELFCASCDPPSNSGSLPMDLFCDSCPEPMIPPTPTTEYSSSSSSMPSSAISSPALSMMHHPSIGHQSIPPPQNNSNKNGHHDSLRQLSLDGGGTGISSTSPSSPLTMPMIPPFSPLPSSTSIPCMWGSCHKSFFSLAELIGHVNLEHLQAQPTSSPSTNFTINATNSSTNSSNNNGNNSNNNNMVLDACHWRDCTQYHTPSLIPSHSSAQDPNIVGLISNHLLQDHLGVVGSPGMFGMNYHTNPYAGQQGSSAYDGQQGPISYAGQQDSSGLGSFMWNHNQQGDSDGASVVSSSATAVHSPSSPTLTPITAFPKSDDQKSPVPTQEGTSTPTTEDTPCTCLWTACNLTFPSSAALTAHLHAAHVGGGKAHYECWWEGCGRNGGGGFGTKQKLCRHLQVSLPFFCSGFGEEDLGIRGAGGRGMVLGLLGISVSLGFGLGAGLKLISLFV